MVYGVPFISSQQVVQRDVFLGILAIRIGPLRAV